MLEHILLEWSVLMALTALHCWMILDSESMQHEPSAVQRPMADFFQLLWMKRRRVLKVCSLLVFHSLSSAFSKFSKLFAF